MRLGIAFAACALFALGAAEAAEPHGAATPAADPAESYLAPGRTSPLLGTSIVRLRKRAAREGTLRVIVGLRLPEPFAPDANLESKGAMRQQKAMGLAKQNLLQRHYGAKPVPGRDFLHIPFLTVEVDAAALAALLADDGVTSIEESITMEPMLMNSGPLVSAPLAWSSGWTGAGQYIVDIDTGYQTDHPFFANRIAWEACFSSTEPMTGPVTMSSCTTGGPQMFGPGAASLQGSDVAGFDHGTLTLGIAAGRDPGNLGFSGIARDASIIAIKAASRGCLNTAPPCATFNDDDVLQALNYVYGLRYTFPIAAINMSFANRLLFYNSRSACSDAHPSFAATVAMLKSAGIATIAAAGNDSRSTGIDFPSCITGVVAVSATTKDDQVAYFSNSDSILDLWAPGAGYSTSPNCSTLPPVCTSSSCCIWSSLPLSNYGGSSGTSLAAPHVTGAFAILKQRTPKASVDKLLTDLQLTGLPITDSRNQVTRSRINIAQALTRGDSTPPTVPQGLTATAIATNVVSVCWQPASDDYGVDHYVVERRSSLVNGFYPVAPNDPGPCFTDMATNGMLEYRVKAVDGSGNESAYSRSDYATTFPFSDDPIVAGSTLVRGAHVAELRQAVDAWRSFSGNLPFWSSYAAPTGPVQASDFTDLVAAYNVARRAMGLPDFAYVNTTAPAAGGVIVAPHIQQIRDSLK
jgi:subtilisin